MDDSICGPDPAKALLPCLPSLVVGVSSSGFGWDIPGASRTVNLAVA